MWWVFCKGQLAGSDGSHRFVCKLGARAESGAKLHQSSLRQMRVKNNKTKGSLFILVAISIHTTTHVGANAARTKSKGANLTSRSHLYEKPPPLPVLEYEISVTVPLHHPQSAQLLLFLHEGSTRRARQTQRDMGEGSLTFWICCRCWKSFRVLQTIFQSKWSTTEWPPRRTLSINVSNHCEECTHRYHTSLSMFDERLRAWKWRHLYSQ